MVRSLHQAGIEVILDVVYNHTAEGARATIWDPRCPSAASTTPPTTVWRTTTDVRSLTVGRHAARTGSGYRGVHGGRV